MAGKKGAQGAEREADQSARISDLEAQQAAAAPAAAPPPASGGMSDEAVDKLQKLAH